MSRSIRNKLIGLAAIVAGLAALYFIAAAFVSGWTPPRDQYPTQGVSVSQDDGIINWPNVRALGADFAYIRATAGSETRDINFAANFAEAQTEELRVGAVHQYSLCRLAQDQATNFVTTVPRNPRALPPAVELSFDDTCTDRPTRSLVLSELETFLNQIESHAGKPALLLIRPEFEEEYRISEANPRTIWLSGNFFPPDYAAKPWVMWQANDYYKIRGIDGPVAWNVVRSSNSERQDSE